MRIGREMYTHAVDAARNEQETEKARVLLFSENVCAQSQIIDRQHYKVVFLMELAGLKGRERLAGYDVASVIRYEGK